MFSQRAVGPCVETLPCGTSIILDDITYPFYLPRVLGEPCDMAPGILTLLLAFALRITTNGEGPQKRQDYVSIPDPCVTKRSRRSSLIFSSSAVAASSSGFTIA